MALSQPPVSWPVVLFAALPVLLWLTDGAGPRGGFAIGWAAGVGYFGAGMFWIVDPFLVEPDVFGWMAPFALAGVAAGLALFWGLPFGLGRAWCPPGVRRILLLAALWTLCDYARSNILTGFPWALIGYAWVETPVIQTTAWFGPHLLSLLTISAALLPGLGSRVRSLPPRSSSRPAGERAHGGSRSRCRSGPSPSLSAWCSRTRTRRSSGSRVWNRSSTTGTLV